MSKDIEIWYNQGIEKEFTPIQIKFFHAVELLKQTVRTS